MGNEHVTIGRFASDVEANLVRARLEAAGLDALVTNELAGAGLAEWLSGGAVLVQVAAEDANDALELLNAPAESPAADQPFRTSEADLAVRCHVCQSSFVEIVNPPLVLRILRFVTSLMIPLPESWFGLASHTCRVCGFRWSEGDATSDRVPPIG